MGQQVAGSVCWTPRRRPCRRTGAWSRGVRGSRWPGCRGCREVAGVADIAVVMPVPRRQARRACRGGVRGCGEDVSAVGSEAARWFAELAVLVCVTCPCPSSVRSVSSQRLGALEISAGGRFRWQLAAIQSAGKSSAVPPGLESLSPLFPALKRWAKLGRPSGAGFPDIRCHWIAPKRVLRTESSFGFSPYPPERTHTKPGE